jgi:hypothetical protein
MALNDKRTIPYDFRVVRIGDDIWLYDANSRTYACSATPLIYCEWLYSSGDEQWPLDPAYFRAVEVEKRDSEKVLVLPLSTTEEEAWDEAREEAQGNHRL